MSISKNLESILAHIPSRVKLVAVSKKRSFDEIMQVYNSGHKIFGENKVQDLVEKFESLPKDIEWHMIGHLQSNKVKYITSFVDLIHSIDSFKLLKIINREAKKINRIINCLIQIHIATEETKFGFSYKEVEDLLSSKEYQELSHIRINGLMGMASFTENEEQIHKEFKYLSHCYQNLKNNFFSSSDNFKELSMGMTNDYNIAITEGSSIVRIGTLIFGDRNYINLKKKE